ncbi:unnamed protein product [Prorocentrum cordatum]|uniref:Midasin AAA lid domain-containing protein n=1 Tax=Prorocentrum cordatum TaxID=2364126 RepID=A0ABN9UBZ6_9DINO|nr:unnamed protein product [Polarella glacialis]
MSTHSTFPGSELKPLCARILASAAVLSGLWTKCPAAFSGSGPTLGLRALLRWCRRLRSAKLVLEPVFVEEGRALLLREAAATLLGRLPDPDLRRELLAGIAQIWGLARGVADTLLDERPSVSVAAGEVAIGHVALPRRPPEDAAAPAPGAPFAYTSVHARVLQALASSIRCDEAVLLVGDTGTGKTSVVQHIGQLLGKDPKKG